MTAPRYGDVSVSLDAHVAQVELHRPPHNYFDPQLVRDLADAFQALDQDQECRALVLCSEGKSFCAGADFQRAEHEIESGSAIHLYEQAVRLFACEKPVVAAIQGAAVGGGLGLALVADFRVVSPEARFAANFVKLGIHPGFGLSYTLPRLIGIQRARLLVYTRRRLTGGDAVTRGLVDELVELSGLRAGALKLAAGIAAAAPLAVVSTRATLRQGLFDAYCDQVRHESDEQTKLLATADAREGIL